MIEPEHVKAIEDIVELNKEKTIQDVYDTLDEDQKKVVNFLVATAVIKTEACVTRRVNREFDILRCAKKIKRCCKLTKDCNRCPIYQGDDKKHCSLNPLQEPKEWEV